MRFISIFTHEPSNRGPTQAEMAAMGKLVEEGMKAGWLVATEGVSFGTTGLRVHRSGDGKVTVTDGPFAEAKETISYAMYQVRSKDEAVEWASRFVKLHRDLWEGWEGEADVLKVFGPEDFGPPA